MQTQDNMSEAEFVLQHTEVQAQSVEQAQRLTAIQALVPRLDAQFLASFVVDLSWGSSVLEGSTYSMLDTEALLLYGQRHPDKPTADAVLALNHRQAAQAL